MVFAILLAPAFIALQIASFSKMPPVIRKYPLIAACVIGILVNILAIVMSYRWDLPTGYAIGFTHCFIAAITAMLVIRKGNDEIREGVLFQIGRYLHHQIDGRIKERQQCFPVVRLDLKLEIKKRTGRLIASRQVKGMLFPYHN